VTSGEYEIIKDWHDSLDKYEPPNKDHYDHGAILSDQRWLDIVQLGLTAKKKLIEILNTDEKRHLTDIVDYSKYT
jgi:hypothetical protein